MKLKFNRLKNIGLYVITDFQMAESWDYEELARIVLQNGAGALQLRDKAKKFEELTEIGKRLRRVAQKYHALFIVNDDPYLAGEVGADGVHLGQEDMNVAEARKIMGPDKIIGLSTHSKDQILAAAETRPDYIGIGPVFSTTTKESPNQPVGPMLISWAAENSLLPFVAIGGINENNITEVLKAGAKNIAVVSAIMAAPDPGEATKQLSTMIKNFEG